MSESHSSASPQHEPVDLRTGFLWRFAFGLLALVLLAMATIHFLFLSAASEKAVPPLATGPSAQPPGTLPQLDPNQPMQRQEYEQAQKKLLDSYGWIDRRQNLAHIPIERAMQLIVQEYGDQP